VSLERLFEPLTFRCGARAKNRLALAPLTNQQSHDDGTLSPDEERFLVRRARGGFGLVSTCAAHVSLDGKGFDGQLGVFDDAHAPGLARLAAALRAEGALSIAQLYHGGARSPSRLTGVQPQSASAFEEAREGFEVPRALTTDELGRIVDAFRDAATRVARAGFDGVELHGAHGYLLSQFLSREMNQRTDAWGGSLERRARLVRLVLAEVRRATPPGFVVGVRLSPEDFGFARGLDVDETIEVARWLADDGADFLHVSLWDHTKPSTKYPSKSACTLVRDAVPSEVRVVAAGKVWTPDDALRVLDLGADAVALGRAAILTPDWPLRAREAGFEPTRPPLTTAALEALDVGPRFVDYLRRFHFVADA
jgi:2,4-dienoyl-CoA reductase-like NADH-dependent reductase (Old Yellow Enzyme family)